MNDNNLTWAFPPALPATAASLLLNELYSEKGWKRKEVEKKSLMSQKGVLCHLDKLS